jgi:hypothetical protein
VKPKGHILWIDDNPERHKFASLIQEESEFRADFRDVKDENLAEYLPDVLRSRPPAMVIIDHVLDKTASQKRIFETGASVAEVVRHKWPSRPVLCVTAVGNMKSIDERTKRLYDGLFLIEDFGVVLPRLPVIARDFLRVSSSRSSKPDRVLALLDVPQQDRERLLAVLPEDIKRASMDPSFASRLYAWVDRVLLERPGFLYDDLWAATFLGITSEALAKVEKRFSGAAYGGVFAFPNRKRWWASTLSEILYQLCPPQPGEMPWEVGRRLAGVTRRDYSQCYACDKPFPQIVAYLDSSSDDRQPMHLECTVSHPGFKKEMFFEEIRMMRGRE